MDTVGAYEAKTQLSKLLDRVAKGESITIEKHGVPVAVLRPVNPARIAPLGDVIAEIKRSRGDRRLHGLTIRELIEEGRR
jgi:prevent-host-death family protein